MRATFSPSRAKVWASALMGQLLLIALSGCGILAEPESEPPVNVEEISITLDSDANLDTATAVDVVIIYRRDVLQALLKMTAAEYFAAADQIKRDYPDVIDVLHWELTPGQRVQNIPLDFRGESPSGALVFANYLTPGAHRIRLGRHDTAHIHLKKYDFCVLEQGCGPLRAFDEPEAAVVRGQLAPRKKHEDSYFEEKVLPRIAPNEGSHPDLKNKAVKAVDAAAGPKAGRIAKEVLAPAQSGQTSLSADHE
ncbi:MAG: hypothetical protein ACK5O7_02435 [Holosporales bacterium]